MKGKTGYLKRHKPSFDSFQKKQEKQKNKPGKYFGVMPDSFKKHVSRYRHSRNAYILKLSRAGNSLKAIKDMFENPFFTESAMFKYLRRCIKDGIIRERRIKKPGVVYEL